MVVIFGFRTLWMWMDRPRLVVPSRLDAVEFVEQHPELRSLGDDEALTVARVLRAELDRRERANHRFDIMLAALSLVAGAVLGALLS